MKKEKQSSNNNRNNNNKKTIETLQTDVNHMWTVRFYWCICMTMWMKLLFLFRLFFFFS